MITIKKIREHEELADRAANWFHQKWGIPLEAYHESIRDCLKHENAVPQWYLAMDHDIIAGGLGVIENDFHDRKDLSPNVCAVYVEEAYRCQGIAGKLLQYVCDDMKKQDIDTLYLLTDHTSFYERYGWEFLCMVQGDGEPDMSRMYIHRQVG
ncbi:MAG: GNAT family N-acetyltransferase [Lachnospiraceae bacterium]|nr:GNAT family N-acetyltransferase [Lachnospiraceae bacterium]MDE7176427.1 GNAT family N-acetyltransferase [Lachnospiraceae bacterium]